MYPQRERDDSAILHCKRCARPMTRGEAELREKLVVCALRQCERPLGATAPDERIAAGERKQRERSFGGKALECRGLRRRCRAQPRNKRVLAVALFACDAGKAFRVHHTAGGQRPVYV